MTTEEMILHIFGSVDDEIGPVEKVAPADWYPSEGVTIGIWFALKGGHVRAFCGGLKPDYDAWFGGLPDRSTLQRPLRAQQDPADTRLGDASWLNGIDSFPIELLFPLREGRSKRQLGKQNRDQGRGSIGIKLGWILNPLGQGVGWHWLTLNCPDQDFRPLVTWLQADGLVLSDRGFRCQHGPPDHLQRCFKRTWHDRRMIETPFSLLTVICQPKKRFQRTAAHLEARLAYPAALFNVVLHRFRQLHSDDPFKLSIAEFSL
jgi:hypothetical protein